ncbi:hypothetical protein QFC19_009358 [Naganishia cerealis]|uniref:Uncharacterized protein n=1 Tax=Naganishia cerealis TaxID=610337 RepID=A0ACC2UX36_9TREE|nr:hypothetical protein QFC19_009358 [Naganishia cerealis]
MANTELVFVDAQLEQSINQSIDQLVLRLQRREISSSRHAALETAQLLYRFVGAAKFASIEQLIGMIKAVGSRLIAANPKEFTCIPKGDSTADRLFPSELAVGNIIRKVLRLIREEYKVACAGHLASLSLDDGDMDTTDDSSDDGEDNKLAEGSIPGTPMPPTPGIHVPSNHFLSDGYPRQAASAWGSGGSGGAASFFPPNAASSDQSPSHSPRPVPKSVHTASLSTFVQMRHNKIQLERAGSTTSVFATGTNGTGFDLTTMTPGIFASDLTSFFTPAINSAQERRSSFPGLTPHTHSATASSHDTTSTKAGGRELRRAQHQAVKQQEQYEAFNKKSMQMKPVLVDAIREVVDEIETTWESCAKGAKEHVHSSNTTLDREIILTVGYSKTVEAFLKAAFKERTFTVIVAETAPSLLGRTMAKALAKHGIPTIIVPDSNIYALMPRVTKVLLGAHAVLANGGFFTVSGALLASMAARAHSTPVVVVAGQFKFAPAWNLHHDIAALDFGDPSNILGYEEGELLDKVEVANPFYDYVKPDLVNLFVTNE